MSRYLIVHPTTGDRAKAGNKKAADTAARTLRREAVEQGCSPRTRCSVTVISEEEFHAPV